MDDAGSEQDPDGQGFAGPLPRECHRGVQRREAWFSTEGQFLLLSLPGEKKMRA